MTRGILVKIHALSGVLFFLLLGSGCTQLVPSEGDVNGPQPAEPAVKATPEPIIEPRPPEKIDTVLEAQLREIIAGAKGKVGVGAVMLETGEAVYIERTTRFPSQSVYKLPIAMAVMKMMDEGRVRIDQEITITPDDYVRHGFHSPIRNLNPGGTVMPLGEIVRYSISESDGTASDVLLDLAGGPQAVQSYLSSIGITDFIVADSEKSISKDWETQYRNWATPQASIDLLRALFDRGSGLSKRTTDILLTAMTETDTGRRRLKSGLLEGAVLAHKTGTGGRASEVPRAAMPGAASNTNRAPSSANSKANSSKNAKANTNANSNTARAKTRRARTKPVNIKASSDDREKITSATNDIGIITLPDGRHILIAVYVADSPDDTPTREKLIADIAKAVCIRWAGSFYPDVR